MCKPVKYVTKVKVTASVLLYWVLIRSEDKKKKEEKKDIAIISVIFTHTAVWSVRPQK